MILLDQIVPAGPGSVRSLRQAMIAALAGTRLPPGLVQDLQTALAEMANNALEHAHPPARQFRLSLHLRGEWLSLRLEDDGAPFHEGAARLAAARLNPLEERFEDGGLGLFLIRRLFPQCDYRPGPPNCFRLRRNLASRRPRLLLIEDETSLRRLYEGMLIDQFDVVPCATGAEALTLCAATRPDAILSDINLPDMNGIDLLATLEGDDARAPVPLVILSGEKDDEVRNRAIDLGIDGFLTKPIGKKLLLDTIRQVLARANRERARLIRHYSGQLARSVALELPDRLGDFACAVRYRTAGAGGGDFILPLAGGDAETLLFGDIMGHGIGAKILCHALAGYISGLARSLEAAQGPATVLDRLSQAVADDRLLDGAVVTALAVRLGGGGAVTLANAGHPQPLIIAHDGVRPVGQVGPLTGLVQAPAYQADRVLLATGERLFLYTDGILPPADSVGDAASLPLALVQVLQDGLALPLAAAADALAAAIDRLTAGQAPDDWTCILLETAC